jgi:hypothetical protein
LNGLLSNGSYRHERGLFEPVGGGHAANRYFELLRQRTPRVRAVILAGLSSVRRDAIKNAQNPTTPGHEYVSVPLLLWITYPDHPEAFVFTAVTVSFKVSPFVPVVRSPGELSTPVGPTPLMSRVSMAETVQSPPVSASLKSCTSIVFELPTAMRVPLATAVCAGTLASP